MDEQPGGIEKARRWIDKGVDIPNPLSIDIGPEVSLDRISGDGVKIYPGCRIYGAGTVISAGVKLGAEGPVTIEDCRLGPEVELKGGYFSKSVFLRRSNMGLGAHVREGTLLEEEAGGAHCVGLKQTVLFPFVTLGSLINFCDCLMAGGTSRKDHSEVGSSYVHFNFTPDGDKTTASLFGDVPRGVMLNQPPIFLGGQGGAVGPVVTGFGTVVAAGCVLRDDVPQDGQLVIPGALPGLMRPVLSHTYRKLERVVAKNLVYMANLRALAEWYGHVRRRFFERQELGLLVYEGALAALAGAMRERARRLEAMVARVSGDDAPRRELRERIANVLSVFDEPVVPPPDEFVEALLSQLEQERADYVKSIKGLPAEASITGTRWLLQIVEDLSARTRAIVPSMDLSWGA